MSLEIALSLLRLNSYSDRVRVVSGHIVHSLLALCLHGRDVYHAEIPIGKSGCTLSDRCGIWGDA